MGDNLVEVRGLRKWFPVQKSFVETLLARRMDYIRAVDGIDLSRDLKALEVLEVDLEQNKVEVDLSKIYDSIDIQLARQMDQEDHT